MNMVKVLIICYDYSTDDDFKMKAENTIIKSLVGAKDFDYIFQLAIDPIKKIIFCSRATKTEKSDPFVWEYHYFLDFYCDPSLFKEHKEFAKENLKEQIESTKYDRILIQQTKVEYYNLVRQYIEKQDKIVFPCDELK